MGRWIELGQSERISRIVAALRCNRLVIGGTSGILSWVQPSPSNLFNIHAKVLVMKKLLALALSFSVFSMMPAVQAAEEAPTWPSWRGVGDTGSTSAGSYATSWSDGKNILWKTALPGKGCSTPIV